MYFLFGFAMVFWLKTAKPDEEPAQPKQSLSKPCENHLEPSTPFQLLRNLPKPWNTLYDKPSKATYPRGFKYPNIMGISLRKQM